MPLDNRVKLAMAVLYISFRMAPGMMIVTNNTNVSHWSLENGYEENLQDEEYPLRVIGSGRSAALELGIVLHLSLIY